MVLPPSTATSRQKRRIEELCSSDDSRFIDFGVKIICVRKGASGTVPPGTNLPRLVKGKRKPVFLGGRWDRILGRFVEGRCRYVTWLVGKKQYDILVGRRVRRNSLLYSAEGAGKTVLMAMWVWVQILTAAVAGVGGTVGATAPTGKRLGTLVKAVTDLAPVGTSRQHIPGEWGTLKVDDNDLHVGTGRHWIQFRSTKKQSGELGSPIQGWNWGLGAAIDECQDSIAAYGDIVARLRAGKEAPIMATATAKDSPLWRNWRDSLSENWTIHRLRYTDTPFVHDSHWEMMQEECSPREWRRRGLAMDVGPERMTYNTWERAANLGPIPSGAIDVTEEVLSRYGEKFLVLVGHDPGNAKDVSVLLKAYRVPGEKRHRWYVVGEVTTDRSTTEVHIVSLRKALHEFGCDPELDEGRPMIKLDPTAEKDIYVIFRKAKLKAKPAEVNPKTDRAATIAKESRIRMVCSLFCNAKGIRRLHVAKNDNGAIAAPKTVESIELSERDAAYEAEKDRKGDTDPTHWMTATGYALWGEEKPRKKKSDVAVESLRVLTRVDQMSAWA